MKPELYWHIVETRVVVEDSDNERRTDDNRTARLHNCKVDEDDSTGDDNFYSYDYTKYIRL